MGSNNDWYALISMVNKDVYYVSEEVIESIFENDDSSFIKFTDAKNGFTVIAALQNISSIVVRGGQDA